jgi:hypothetical protein
VQFNPISVSIVADIDPGDPTELPHDPSEVVHIQSLKVIDGYMGLHIKYYILQLIYTYINTITTTTNTKALIDSRTLKKIELVRSGMFSPQANNFDPSQVEKRFGGSMENILQFWMPISTIHQPTRSDPNWRYEVG